MKKFNYIKWITNHKHGLITEQVGTGSATGSSTGSATGSLLFHNWKYCNSQPSNNPYPYGSIGQSVIIQDTGQSSSPHTPQYYNTPALSMASISWYNSMGSPSPGNVINIYVDSTTSPYNICCEYLGTTTAQNLFVNNPTTSWHPSLTPGNNYYTISTHSDCNDCVSSPTGSGTNTTGSITLYGCLDQNAINYNPTVNVDDGSCMYIGCADQNAINYSSNNVGCSIQGPTDTSCCDYAQIEPRNPCDDVTAWKNHAVANYPQLSGDPIWKDHFCEYCIDGTISPGTDSYCKCCPKTPGFDDEMDIDPEIVNRMQEIANIKK